MVDISKGAKLYRYALDLATQTPQIGNKLAGNCVTVHYGVLEQARQLFGDSVGFVVGHIEVGGEKRFYFSDDELESWCQGSQKPRYNLHAWLSLGNDLIDLTLAPTTYEIDSTLLPLHLTYFDRDTARSNGITHVERLKGDDVPFRLGLAR